MARKRNEETGETAEAKHIDAADAETMMDCIDRRQRAVGLQNKCLGGSTEAIVLSAIVAACDQQIAEWAIELGGDK